MAPPAPGKQGAFGFCGHVFQPRAGLWSSISVSRGQRRECAARKRPPIMHCLVSTTPRQPRMAYRDHRSHISGAFGQIRGVVAPYGADLGGFWTNLGLRVDLGAPLRGASDIQPSSSVGSWPHLPLGSKWTCCSMNGRALELDICISGTRSVRFRTWSELGSTTARRV